MNESKVMAGKPSPNVKKYGKAKSGAAMPKAEARKIVKKAITQFGKSEFKIGSKKPACLSFFGKNQTRQCRLISLKASVPKGAKVVDTNKKTKKICYNAGAKTLWDANVMKAVGIKNKVQQDKLYRSKVVFEDNAEFFSLKGRGKVCLK